MSKDIAAAAIIVSLAFTTLANPARAEDACGNIGSCLGGAYRNLPSETDLRLIFGGSLGLMNAVPTIGLLASYNSDSRGWPIAGVIMSSAELSTDVLLMIGTRRTNDELLLGLELGMLGWGLLVEGYSIYRLVKLNYSQPINETGLTHIGFSPLDRGAFFSMAFRF